MKLISNFLAKMEKMRFDPKKVREAVLNNTFNHLHATYSLLLEDQPVVEPIFSHVITLLELSQKKILYNNENLQMYIFYHTFKVIQKRPSKEDSSKKVEKNEPSQATAPTDLNEKTSEEIINNEFDKILALFPSPSEEHNASNENIPDFLHSSPQLPHQHPSVQKPLKILNTSANTCETQFATPSPKMFHSFIDSPPPASISPLKSTSRCSEENDTNQTDGSVLSNQFNNSTDTITNDKVELQLDITQLPVSKLHSMDTDIGCRTLPKLQPKIIQDTVKRTGELKNFFLCKNIKHKKIFIFLPN